MNDLRAFELVTFCDGAVDLNIPAVRTCDIEAAEMLSRMGGGAQRCQLGEVSSHVGPATVVVHTDDDKYSSWNLKWRTPEALLLLIVRTCLALASVQPPPLPEFQTVFLISNERGFGFGLVDSGDNRV